MRSTVLRRCSRHQTGWIWDAGNQRYRYRFDWDPLDRMRWHNGPGINRVLAYTADGERIVERDLAGAGWGARRGREGQRGFPRGMGWRVGSAIDRAATVFPPLTNGVTTISLRGLDAKILREVKLQNGAYSWQKDYIYREGQILASHGNNEPLQHYHLDHLGTPRMLSNRCGERLQRFESFPFGEAIAELPQHPEKMRLTGHQRDLSQPSTTEDDLDYMHARYYGTKMGRFLGVDRGGPKAGSPRSWNRYSYVIGNPLVLLDPFGLAEVYFSIGLQPGKVYATSDGGRKVHLPERSYELGREYAAQNVFAGKGIEAIRWRVGANASAAQFTKDVGVIRDVSVVVSHTFGSDTPNPRIVFMESSGGQTSTNLGGARIRNAVVILATCNSAPIAEKMGLTADGGQAAVGVKGSVNLTSLMGMASYLVDQLAQGVPIAQAVENTRAYFKGSGGEQLVWYGDPSVNFKKTKQTH